MFCVLLLALVVVFVSRTDTFPQFWVGLFRKSPSYFPKTESFVVQQWSQMLDCYNILHGTVSGQWKNSADR